MNRRLSEALEDDLQAVTGLRRLINAHTADLAAADSQLTSADLVASLYLALLLGVPDVSAKAPLLSRALAAIWNDAKRFAADDAGEGPVRYRALELVAFGDVSAHRALDDRPLTVVYGISRRSTTSEWSNLSKAFSDSTVVPIFGQSLALWRSGSVVVAPASAADEIDATLSRLALVFNDTAFDPLKLSEICERLRLRAHTPESGVVYHDDETAIALGARIEALELELKHLRHSNVQQQRAIGLLNVAFVERGHD